MRYVVVLIQEVSRHAKVTNLHTIPTRMHVQYVVGGQYISSDSYNPHRAQSLTLHLLTLQTNVSLTKMFLAARSLCTKCFLARYFMPQAI